MDFISKLFNKSRYFIVFYDCYEVGTNKALTGNLGAESDQNNFLSRKAAESLIILANKLEDGTSVNKICITNIIELSKRDYYTWMSDIEADISYGNDEERIAI